MTRDAALAMKVVHYIENGYTAAAAIDLAITEFVDLFNATGGYLAERTTDLLSVRDRCVARLLNDSSVGLPDLNEPAVVCAADLSPADTATLNLELVQAIITEEGGPTGHTAIIAAQLGVSCVVKATGIMSVPSGTHVAVDAAAGTITTHPSSALLRDIAERESREEQLRMDDSPGATSDGHAVELLANIGTPRDARHLSDTAVEGVGLFRTEMLYLDEIVAPDRTEQLPTYQAVLDTLTGRKVVVRTLDAGADKPLAFAEHGDEQNPALGVRGYRLVRTMPQLLEEQLAALGTLADNNSALAEKLWVMAPMISTPTEAIHFARLARAHGISRAGVMIEVPAAAIHAEKILDEVDFVSIGSNDLAQYVMSTDLLSPSLSDLLDPWQPAVLELIANTARAGRKLNKPVGVCGESAAQPLMALVLTGLGVTSLSMAPTAIPAVRYALARHSLEQCVTLAHTAVNAPDAQQAQDLVRSLCDPNVIDFLNL
jgi:phosphotransferase system enzyme I (PtsI)